MLEKIILLLNLENIIILKIIKEKLKKIMKILRLIYQEKMMNINIMMIIMDIMIIMMKIIIMKGIIMVKKEKWIHKEHLIFKIIIQINKKIKYLIFFLIKQKINFYWKKNNIFIIFIIRFIYWFYSLFFIIFDILGIFFCKNSQQDTTINDNYSGGNLKYYICWKWKYKNNKWFFEHKVLNKEEYKCEEFKTKEVWNKFSWYFNKCNHWLFKSDNSLHLLNKE